MFLATNMNLLFRSRNYFKSFQCKTGYGWQKAVDFNVILVFKTSQKNSHHYRRPFNATLISPNNNVQVQPLENLLNNFFSLHAKQDNFISGSSRLEVFCTKCVLKNFAKFTVKYLCQSLFLTKLQFSASSFIKKETLALMFSCELCEIPKNTFSFRPSPPIPPQWLLLYPWKISFEGTHSCLQAR